MAIASNFSDVFGPSSLPRLKGSKRKKRRISMPKGMKKAMMPKKKKSSSMKKPKKGKMKKGY